MSKPTNVEKSRRSTKAIVDNVGAALTNIIGDQDDFEKYLKTLRTTDQRLFNDILKMFLPRMAPVDQDFEKTKLGLKDVLLDIPDVKDIGNELKTRTAERDKALYDLKIAEEDKEIWRKKYLKALEK
jgi:hypothetical protein